MTTNKRAPSCWHSVGATKQDARRNDPVPIITRATPRRKRKSREEIAAEIVVALIAVVTWGWLAVEYIRWGLQ